MVRDPSSLAGVSDEDLEVFTGDVLEPGSLDEGFKGCLAVLFTVGGGREKESATVYSEGIRNVLDAMDRYVIDRLVCVSAAGVGPTKDPNMPGLQRRLLLNPALKRAYAEMARMEEVVFASDTVWTVVRPASLTDGPLTGVYRVAEGRSLPGGKYISRADVAAFMLKCLTTDVWDRKAVALAY